MQTPSPRRTPEQYPELAAEENVPERIDRIDNTLAGKLYGTADFYRRIGRAYGTPVAGVLPTHAN